VSLFPPHVRLVVFDADGTLRLTTVPAKPCPHDPTEWKLLPGIRTALASAKWGPGGLKIALASNQDHVAYGHLTERMARRLLLDAAEAATGVRPPLWAAFLCPHPMDAGCGCRKPAPGLLLKAMVRYRVSPRETLFVGDAEVDSLAAAAAGVAFLHVAELLAPMRNIGINL
jgi:HAD superfamily hydrolase (TIGR01662 family)